MSDDTLLEELRQRLKLAPRQPIRDGEDRNANFPAAPEVDIAMAESQLGFRKPRGLAWR